MATTTRLTAIALAEALGVSTRTILRWQIPCARTHGGHPRYDARSVAAWLRANDMEIPALLATLTKTKSKKAKKNVHHV